MNASVTNHCVPPVWQSLRFRFGGLLPLAFFVVRLVDYVNWGTPAHIWWNCHVANLTLAIGMFFSNRLLIRLAGIWLVLGVPPWAVDMCVTGIIWPIAVLTHLGGAVFGLIVLRLVRMARGIWWVALLWFVVLQQLSRYLTPAAYNVNVAHRGYGVINDWFGSYWQYWLANTLGTAFLLWALEWVLARVWPEADEQAGGAK